MIVFKIAHDNFNCEILCSQNCMRAINKGELVKCEFNSEIYYGSLYKNSIYIDFGSMVVSIDLSKVSTKITKENKK